MSQYRRSRITESWSRIEDSDSLTKTHSLFLLVNEEKNLIDQLDLIGQKSQIKESRILVKL
jgi:hypothetical protein